MHIICPYCTTSYAIDLATFGGAGRTVRCSRCKEVWLARPEDAIEVAARGTGDGAPPADQRMPRRSRKRLASRGRRHGEQDTPVVDSPSISGDWPAADKPRPANGPAGRRGRADGGCAAASRADRPWRRTADAAGIGRQTGGRGFPTVCLAMAALVLAFMIWRVDVVRLLPQTASFYKRVGLEVNLRGLVFKDVKLTRRPSKASRRW